VPDPESPTARADAPRRAFLAKVEAILGTLPVDVEVTYREVETAPESAFRWGAPPGVRGLVVRSASAVPSVGAVAQVVAANVRDEADAFDAFGGRLTRERSLAFDPFPQEGRAVYRLYLLEHPWEARGHGRWSPPARALESGDPAEVAMAVAAWAAPVAERLAPGLPNAATRVARLRRLLEARRAGLTAVEVVRDLGPAELVEAAGEPDLARVGRRLLAWHFPRDQQGRLRPRTTVALVCCRQGQRPQARQLWLCAEGPAGARDAQRIRLRLRWEHGVNQDHRWDGARHLWHSGDQGSGLDARWGVGDRSRADRSAELMAEGRFREGLELYGVELSPEADQVAQGRVPWYELRHLAGTWTSAMRSQLAGAAPWLLASTAARDARAAGRPVRLFGLGGQSIARKPGLFLAAGPDRAGRPRLEVHWSAANARLPLVAWRRPEDYELLRLGLAGEEELLAVGRAEP